MTLNDIDSVNVQMRLSDSKGVEEVSFIDKSGSDYEDYFLYSSNTESKPYNRSREFNIKG